MRNFLAESFEEMVLEVLSDKIEDAIKDENLLIPAVINDQKMEGEEQPSKSCFTEIRRSRFSIMQTSS